MAEFASFFHQILNKRVEAPDKMLFILEELPKQKLREASQNSIQEMIPFFVDNIREYIDFKIKPLSPSNPDYQEFLNDPKTPLLNYVQKITQETQCEWAALPGAIVLLERLRSKLVKCKISVNNMHRLLLISLCIADKFFEDLPVSNSSFASAGGFTSQTLLGIEIEFLQCLSFDVFISREEIDQVLKKWNFTIIN